MHSTGIFYTSNTRNFTLLNQVAKLNKVNLIKSSNISDFSFKISSIKPNFVFIDIVEVKLHEQNLTNNFFNQNDIEVYIINNESTSSKDNNIISKDKAIKYLKTINIKLNLVDTSTDFSNSVTAIYSTIINKLLLDLGFSPKHTGMKYLTEILLLILKSNGRKDILSSVCYPIIAKRYSKSIATVDHSIRCSIEYAWLYNKNLWQDFFNYQFLKNGYRPTIKELTNLLVQRVFETYCLFVNGLINLSILDKFNY